MGVTANWLSAAKKCPTEPIVVVEIEKGTADAVYKRSESDWNASTSKVECEVFARGDGTGGIRPKLYTYDKDSSAITWEAGGYYSTTNCPVLTTPVAGYFESLTGNLHKTMQLLFGSVTFYSPINIAGKDYEIVAQPTSIDTTDVHTYPIGHGMTSGAALGTAVIPAGSVIAAGESAFTGTHVQYTPPLQARVMYLGAPGDGNAAYTYTGIGPVRDTVFRLTYRAAVATFTTPSFDLGSPPTSSVQVNLLGKQPGSSTITINAWSSPDNSNWTNRGAVADGGLVTAARYYKFDVTLTCSCDSPGNLKVPELYEIRLVPGSSTYEYYSTAAGISIPGFTVHNHLKSISGISSKIGMKDKPTVGDLTLVFNWLKEGSSLVLGSQRKRSIRAYIGFTGLAWADYAPYFTGVWDSVTVNNDKREITLKIRDIWKLFKKKIPEIQFSEGKATTEEYEISGHIIDAITDVAEKTLVPARFIDDSAFTALKSASYASGNWDVYRRFDQQESSDDLMNELAVSAGLFLVPGHDGKLRPQHFDTAVSGAASAVLDAGRYAFSEVKTDFGETVTQVRIYYGLYAGKSGGSVEDFSNVYLDVNAAAETDRDERVPLEWKDKWGLAAEDTAQTGTALTRLADRLLTWYCPTYSIYHVSTGTVSVTVGSNIVQGSGTSWTSDIKPGMVFQVDGDTHSYRITSVNPSLQQLILDVNYGLPTDGSTGSGKTYSIDKHVAVAAYQVTVSGLPLWHFDLTPGQVVAVDNLRLPAPVASWGGFSSGTKFMIMGKRVDAKNWTISLDLRQVGAVTYKTATTWATYTQDLPRTILPTAGVGLIQRDSSVADSVVVTGSQFFKFSSGATVPDVTSIVLTATLSGALTTYDWEYWTGSAWTNLSGTQNEQTYTIAHDNAAWGSASSLRIRCLSDTVFDEITVYKLYDGDTYTISLTNAAHNLPTTTAGTVTYTGSGTSVQVFKGATELNSVTGTPTAGQFSVSASVTLGTVTVGAQTVTGNAADFADHSAMATDHAVITYTVNVENKFSVPKKQGLTKAWQGATGNTGATGPAGSDGAPGPGLTRSTSPPGSPVQYELWFNYSTTDGTYYANTQYQWVGSNWIPTSPRGTKIDANGNYIGVLTASQVNAVAIDAASITTGIMTGRFIRTASSGARVEINNASSPNSIVFIDSGGIERAWFGLQSGCFLSASDTTNQTNIAWFQNKAASLPCMEVTNLYGGTSVTFASPGAAMNIGSISLPALQVQAVGNSAIKASNNSTSPTIYVNNAGGKGLDVTGTAASTFAGGLTVSTGGITVSAGGLTVSAGGASIAGGIAVSGGPIGYKSGEGGTVTQSTNKGTAVTLNEYTGNITMNNAALAADTTITFTLNNSLISTSMFVIVTPVGGGTIGSYSTMAVAGAGYATIYLRNISAGSLSEAIVLKYCLFYTPTT